MQSELLLHVVEEMQGVRIDRLLAQKFPQITRSKFQKLLRDGHVIVRGKKVRSAYRVLLNDDIQVQLPPPQPLDLVPENIPLNIVYEDEELLVVDKPAGLVVHPAVGNHTGTLVHALLYRWPDLSGGDEATRPGIVHRLDKDTSGLIMVAKNERSHALLSAAIQRREVRRDYLALVWGHLTEPKGMIVGAIGRHPQDRKKMTVCNQGGKEARTLYEERERFSFASLLDVHLDTGRTHQIRVHMAWRGHAVIGDPVYGGRNANLTRLPSGFKVTAGNMLKCLNRQALHASRLAFESPLTHEKLEFVSPLPSDIDETLAMLRRSGSGALG